MRPPVDPRSARINPRACRIVAPSLAPLLLVASLIAAVSFIPGISAANVAPESAILIHVQPVTGTCATPITNCNDIIRTTTEVGTMEFLLFFCRMWSWSGEEIELSSLHADLIWPESWNLLEFDSCYGWGDLNPGGSSHALDIDWYPWCPVLPDDLMAIFPVARLVMEVNGPGRLDYLHPSSNPVTLGCYGDQFITYAVGVDAEAGMDCEYTQTRCGGNEYCVAAFDPSELLLSAPPGSAVWGEVGFTAVSPTMQLCSMAVDTRAPWAQAEIVPQPPSTHALLRVRADATGLAEGTYQTSIQLSSSLWHVARCLPVTFTVAQSAAGPTAPGDHPPEVRLASWGAIKEVYRRPSR